MLGLAACGSKVSRCKRLFVLFALVMFAAAACFSGMVGPAGAVNDVCGGGVLPVITPFLVTCNYAPGDLATFYVPAGVTGLHISGAGGAGQPGEAGMDFDPADCAGFFTPPSSGGPGAAFDGTVSVEAPGGAVGSTTVAQ